VIGRGKELTRFIDTVYVSGLDFDLLKASRLQLKPVFLFLGIAVTLDSRIEFHH